jgi:hypothetical protein
VAQSISAAVQAASDAQATADGKASASSVTTLQAQVAGTQGSALKSAIEQEAIVRADQTGALYAKYGIKLDVSGYTIGWAANNDGVSGSIIYRTDTFAVGGTGLTPIQPFVIQTSAQTVNGVEIPAGVYMDAAYIKNLSVLWARFGTLVADSITAASLSAAQLTVGDGTVGGNLKSAGYASGVTGWMLRPDGYAEFSNMIARGTVYASSGAIGGAIVGSSYIQSSGWSSGTGWRLNNDGTGWIGGIYMGANFIQSANYSSGSSGFKISGNGSIEALSGSIGGIGIDTAGIRSANFSPSYAGWQIRNNGSAEFNGVVISRNLVVASGLLQIFQSQTAISAYPGTSEIPESGFVEKDLGSFMVDTGITGGIWNASGETYAASAGLDYGGGIYLWYTGGLPSNPIYCMISMSCDIVYQYRWETVSKVYIRVRVKGKFFSNATHFRFYNLFPPGGIQWKLYKVT